MKSSLALDANRRVEEYRRSVLSVQENVLLFKGFLGPALRERRGMATVGVRAARAAGVIVDADGKLRCPPGTPNANQFTDLQMSNCLVPGAAAIKKGIRRGRIEVAKALAILNEAMTNDKKSRVARVATTVAVAYLEMMDYQNFESQMGQIAVIGVDVLRAGGRDILEKAFDGLERRGKITPEQRKELEGMLNLVHEQGMPKYVAGLMAAFRRRKDRIERKPDIEKVDVPEVAPKKAVEFPPDVPAEYQLYKPTKGLEPFQMKEEMIEQATKSLNERFTKELLDGSDSNVPLPETGNYKEEMIIRTWDIGGKKIQFTNADGLPDDPSVERIPRSVKGLTGLDPATPDGFAMAQKYSAALYASMYADAHDPTYVDALMYAASRGDERAQQELDELAEIGEKLIGDAKKLRSDRLIESAAQYQDTIDASPITRGLGFDDLYAFHESAYDFEIGEDGSLRLYPVGHFYQGERGGVRRPTIHTAINHTAAGHFQRPEGGNSKHVAAFKVADAIEANPDSLENLYAVDTYFTTKPGKPLIIPAGKFRVIEYAGEDGTVTPESRGSALEGFWREEYAKVNAGEGGIRRFAGSDAYSNTAQDSLLARLAGERGVASTLHDSQGGHTFLDATHAGWSKDSDGQISILYKPLPSDAMEISSRNARAQMLSHGEWLGSGRIIQVEENGPPGAVRSDY